MTKIASKNSDSKTFSNKYDVGQQLTLPVHTLKGATHLKSLKLYIVYLA